MYWCIFRFRTLLQCQSHQHCKIQGCLFRSFLRILQIVFHLVIMFRSSVPKGTVVLFHWCWRNVKVSLNRSHAWSFLSVERGMKHCSQLFLNFWSYAEPWSGEANCLSTDQFSGVKTWVQITLRKILCPHHFRDATIQRWYDKTRVASGKLGKGFAAFEQSALKQVEQVCWHPYVRFKYNWQFLMEGLGTMQNLFQCLVCHLDALLLLDSEWQNTADQENPA